MIALAALLTVNTIFSVHPLAGIAPVNFTWSPDGTRFVYMIPSPDANRPATIHIRNIRTGVDRILLRARAQVRGSRSRPISQVVWSPSGDQLAYLNGDELWVADASGERAFKLADGADDPQWSPGGTRIAYVRNNDLFTVSLVTRRSTQLTSNGSLTRINGDPDWLYSEEMDVAHAYAWAPRGDAIAYLAFDESRVPVFPIQNYLPTRNTVEYQRYPLAGELNPRVSLHVVDLQSRHERVLYNGAPRDEYVVSFVWTPDGNGVLEEILDRSQRHLRLELLARNGSFARTVWSEEDPRFVDVQPAPIFLPDGHRFVWLSARGGVQGMYLVDLRAPQRARLLTGSTAIAEILRADPDGIYATALVPNRRNLSLVHVLLDGKLYAVTREPGWHTIAMPKRGDAYIDGCSSFSQPPSVAIRSLTTQRSDMLFSTPSLARYNLGTTRALEVPSHWGLLDAEITVPRDFNPSRRYPVIFSAYGGPLSVGDSLPSSDRWQGLYPFLLAQEGYLVFSIDGPASIPNRAANSRLFSGSMGEIAMAGQLAGARWLAAQPYVDSSRLGLYGWSYGGYLTAYTLTHAPGAFRSGIAGAPPADWRYYDTAYTERYMGVPAHNAMAYERTSVLPAAHNLSSRMLIIQGSSDDNVHLMNSIALLQAFIQAGKQVDYFLYPGARHGVSGIEAQRNLYTRMLLWWQRTL